MKVNGVNGNSSLGALHREAISSKDLLGRILLRLKIFFNTNVFKPQNQQELNEAKIQVKLLITALASNSAAAVKVAASKTHSCKKESGALIDGIPQTLLTIKDGDVSQTLELPTENLDLITTRLHQLKEQLALIKFPASPANLQYFSNSAPKKVQESSDRQDKTLIEATSEAEKRFLIEAGYRPEDIKVTSSLNTNKNSKNIVPMPEQSKVKSVVNNKNFIKAIIEAEKKCLVELGYNVEDAKLILDSDAVVQDNMVAASRQGHVADLDMAIVGLEGAYTPYAIVVNACAKISPAKLSRIQENIGKRMLERAIQQFNDEVEDLVSAGWQNILGTEHELSLRYNQLIVSSLHSIELPTNIKLKSISLADIADYETTVSRSLEKQLGVLNNDILPDIIKEITRALRLKKIEG